MVSGPQSLKYELIALQFESGGVAGTVPTVYPIPNGKITPVGTKGSEETYVSGIRTKTFTTMMQEGAKLSVPLPALLDGNGLGEFLLLAFGQDTPTKVSANLAYDHDFALTDTIQTVTVWAYHPSQTVKYRMNFAAGWKIEAEKGKRIVVTFDLEGAQVMDGSEFVLDTAKANFVHISDSPNILMGSDAYLEYGSPVDAIRDNWSKLTITGKTGNKFGIPGKNAPIPAGSSAPRACVGGDVDITTDIEFVNSDDVEFRRFAAGGNTTPTAIEHRDDAALVGLKFNCFGSSLEAGLNVESDLNNVGTSGIANLAVYSTAQNSNKDITFTARVPGATPTITYASGSGSLRVAVVGSAVTVTQGSGSPTADDIINIINNTAASAAVMTAKRKGTQTGLGVTDPFTVQSLVLATTAVTCTVGGSYTGSDVAVIEVQMDGSTTFKWRLNGGTWTTLVTITGSAQTLGSTGITVLFSATTGMTIGDKYLINTHYRRLLQVYLAQNRIKSCERVETDEFPRGKTQITYVGGKGDQQPTIKMRNLRATAYA